MLVRSAPLGPEEEGVLVALAARLSARGIELGTVLTGTASYEAERSDGANSRPSRPVFLLDEETRGRGLRPSPEGGVRPTSIDELVEALMAAERVIPFS